MVRQVAYVRTVFGTTEYVVSDNVSASGIGAHVIAAAESGYRMVWLVAKLIFSDADSEVSVESTGGEVLSGPYSVAQNSGSIDPPFNELAHFCTPKDEGLAIGLSQDISVGGHVVYGLIPAK